MRQFFGTDGIRGRFGAFPINGEFFEKIGRAISSQLVSENSASEMGVFIGHDTRASATVLKSALVRGLGPLITIYDGGVLSTPAIAFLTRHYGAMRGIAITASHNPFDDNGVKILNGNGDKLSIEEELRLEERICHCTPKTILAGEKQARVIKTPNEFLDAYEQHWEHAFDGRPLAGLTIVFDAANGATAAYGTTFLTRLGAKVIPIGNFPTGSNINENCGTEHGQIFCETVRDTGAQLGIAVDGDGDRAVICDCDGEILSGEHLLATLAIDFHRQKRLKSACLVTTISSNTSLDQALSEYGIGVYRCDVGDRNVAQTMKRMGSNLGGEPSGHVICTDFSPIADGLFTAVAFIQALADGWDFRIAHIPGYFPLNACATLNLPVIKKIPIEEQPGLQEAIAAVEEEIAADGAGRVLVRYSGTENKLRILAEAISAKKANAFAQRLARAAEKMCMHS